MERIISKEHADSIFGMTKREWEQNFKQFFAVGWDITTTPIDTGKSVTAYDPTTGFSLFIQPKRALYASATCDIRGAFGRSVTPTTRNSS